MIKMSSLSVTSGRVSGFLVINKGLCLVEHDAYTKLKLDENKKVLKKIEIHHNFVSFYVKNSNCDIRMYAFLTNIWRHILCYGFVVIHL
jgi:hypothetical protein